MKKPAHDISRTASRGSLKRARLVDSPQEELGIACISNAFTGDAEAKPSRQTGGDMQSRAPINMLATQEESLVASLQTQLHLQNQLLAAHARIDQHEDRLASLFSSPAGAALTSSPAGAALSKGDGPSVASLAQSGGNLPPFRVGGVERPGYEYIGLNSGVPIWGRQAVVRDSVNAHADE
jgi:hypothetical protein